VILASASKYFLEVFLTEDVSKITKFDAPKPIPVNGDADDALSKILKFIYNNQNFEVIKEEINENNAIFLMSQAHTLKSDYLKSCIEGVIIEKILKPDNCTSLYLDSLKFNTETLQKQCEEHLVIHFEEISKQEKGLQFLMDLPEKAFRSLISADNLYITDE
jgi:hypothetical protein